MSLCGLWIIYKKQLDMKSMHNKIYLDIRDKADNDKVDVINGPSEAYVLFCVCSFVRQEIEPIFRDICNKIGHEIAQQ